MNDIPTRQNLPHQLRRLLAVNELYYRAKRAQQLQVFLTAMLPVGLVVVALIVPPLEAGAALGGLLLSIIDVIALDPRQTRLRMEASAVRDAFDRELFGDASAGAIAREGVHEEDVLAAARGAESRGVEEARMRNWYPVAVSVLPMPLARLLCLRANVVWDSRLRRNYAVLLAAIGFALPAASLVLGLVLNLSVHSMILRIFVPISPAALWSLREWLRHREALDLSQGLSSRIMDSVERCSRGEVSLVAIADESRSLQWQIAEWRRSVPPLPEWLYARTRSNAEQEMQQATSVLIARIQEHYSGSGG